MPVCLMLTKKGEVKPTPLAQIDEELCALLGVECHPQSWVANWDTQIQFPLALGRTWEEIRGDGADVVILDYLEANYDAEAWYQRR